MKTPLFLFADYYDVTTASARVLKAGGSKFRNAQFLYWARTGVERDDNNPVFVNNSKEAFIKVGKPRSAHVLLLFLNFQFWLLKKIFQKKSNLIYAFTFYTVFPALLYKYLFAWKTKVIYDPRDYIAVSYRVNKIIRFSLQFFDNLAILLSNKVVFPDDQYFSYYGFFGLSKQKYCIVPNSMTDLKESIEVQSVHEKYNIPKSKRIIPIIGYFSETRGRDMFFELIEMQLDQFHFIVAGDIRDEEDIRFFNQNKNVTLLKKVPYLEALQILRDSYVSPLIYDPETINNKYAYPTKYYDSLMVGTPVIISYGQVPVYNEVEKYDIGKGINYNSTQDLLHVLEQYDYFEKEVDRRTMRQLFLEKYDFKIHQGRMSAFFSNI
jgi:hypothetical protein